MNKYYYSVINTAIYPISYIYFKKNGKFIIDRVFWGELVINKDIDEQYNFKRKYTDFEMQIEEDFSGNLKEFSLDLNLDKLTNFGKNTLRVVQNISFGETITYKGIAENIGSRAYRAIGSVCKKNPFPVVIPCHRVISQNSIGGYMGKTDSSSLEINIKKKLLEFEKII